MPAYEGLLFIGDPHLASRAPGVRRADFPTAALAKLTWCLDYAASHRLLPAILGDLFHDKRERNLAYLGELARILVGREVLTIWGNHDIVEDDLTDGQALMVLVKSGLIQLIDERKPWHGEVAGRKIYVGGSSYGKRWPASFPPGFGSDVDTFWMTHHEITTTDPPCQIDGIDFVINGHLHKYADPVRIRRTSWFNPGNIVRCSRAEVDGPRILRFDRVEGGWAPTMVDVPHEPFDQVFLPKGAVIEGPLADDDMPSRFVEGLEHLERSSGIPGEGAHAFLETNRSRFEPAVYDKLHDLLQTVTDRHA